MPNKTKFIPTPKKITLRSVGYYAPSLRWLRGLYGSDAAIRKEYRRLQAAIDKRYKRAVKAGYGETPVAREMAKVVRISQLRDMQDVVYMLNKAYGQLTRETFTLAGIRESRRKAMQTMVDRGQILSGTEAGTTPPSEGSLDVLFMVARKRGYLAEYGSQEVYTLYKARQEKGKAVYENAQQWQGVVTARQVQLQKLRGKLSKIAQSMEGSETV